MLLQWRWLPSLRLLALWIGLPAPSKAATTMLLRTSNPTQYLGFEDEDYILSGSDLSDIIDRWGRRYKDTYALYIDNEDDIQLSSINSESTKDAKVILVRCHKDRWQACCHFEEEKGSVDTTLDNSVTNQRSAPQASVYSMHDQPPNSAASMAPEDHDSSANAVNNTSALTDSTIEKLINTIERLVTGVEDLTLAVEDRRKPEESACVAINKLTASLDKTPRDAQADGQSDFDGVTDHHDSKASTEYDLGINTPSTVQDVGETNWISDSSDHDEDSATVLRSMPRTTVSAFDAYVAWARTQENCVVFDLAPRGSNFSSQRVDDGASLRDLHPKPPLQQVKDT